MQRTDNTGKAKTVKRHVGSSTTLNRRYVRRPTTKMEAPKVKAKTKVETIEIATPEIEEADAAILEMDAMEDTMSEMEMEMVNVAIPEAPIEDIPVTESESIEVTTPEAEVTRVVKPRARSIDISAPVAVKKSSKIQRFNVSTPEPTPIAISSPVTSKPMLPVDEMTVSTTPIRRFSTGPSRPLSVASVGTTSDLMASAASEQMPMTEIEDTMPEMHPLQRTANTRMQARKVTKKPADRKTAKELKDEAIRKAMMVASATENSTTNNKRKKTKTAAKLRFGVGRVVLALSCAAIAVFAIVYFVNLNMPDVSLKVAAMQTGINASYPTYVPRDYSISSITSENKKITLVFKNSKTEESFSIVEETSSWDSNALLSNYVKDAYGENYQVVKEQGLTIYISGSNATWVNGGVMFKINAEGDTLSNKQIKAIATSL